MTKVSFKARQGVYLTYKNYTYKAPQVFGEFIDNSIQSYESNKNLLLTSESGYKLRVDISIDWDIASDNVVKAKSITITDNAAGMTLPQFIQAFDLADTNVTRTGMNEFGIGMKAAASWLGNNWRVESTSIVDGLTRIVDIDLNHVVKENIEEIDYIENRDESKSHGTSITITNLWSENPILKSNREDLIKSIASIYRYFIRTGELLIYVDDTLLNFEEYEILKAPSYQDPDGEDIVWKCPVSIDDGQGHGVSGFIALLKDTADEKRGVVIMRNHRVVMGFDPKDRTVGKIFYGQIGSQKYRRVFGELEITGLGVAFGKNQVNDPNLLEALCSMVAGKLNINGTNLLTQGSKYTKKKRKPKPPVQPQPPVQPGPQEPETSKPQPSVKPAVQPPMDSPGLPDHTNSEPPTGDNPQINYTNVLAKGTFKFEGSSFQIQVESSSESEELFWNDLSQQDENILRCKLNVSHPFFSVYGKPTLQLLAMIKALSIAKFKATLEQDGSARAMMGEFNDIINTQKVQE